MSLAERRKPNVPPPDADAERGHGRHADTPSQVPARGWLDILSRTGSRISVDNVSIVAAGVGFWAFFSIVPALAAIIGIYGLISNPSAVTGQIQALARILPHEVLPLLDQQLRRITTNSHSASIGTIIGLVIALYSCGSATRALMQGLNICYEENEKRGFLKYYAVGFVLTLGAVVGAILALTIVALLPPLLQRLPLPAGLNTAFEWVRWPVLFIGFIFGLAVLYRYGPSRRDAKWAWVSWGAMAATLLWVIGSALFSLYVSQFGSYDKTYGSLGAVIVFLMWLYITVFAVLFGAELNSEMERQTLKDTTEGPPKPLGARGARSADTVGPTRGEAKAEEKARPPQRQRRS
ncbi:MAG TPA: YihY/virulence factor BrkB family protein [Opitutaceae bacterium]|nr:YihY/virulence factor BrkB family protein [Opitutaceae bacterium]